MNRLVTLLFLSIAICWNAVSQQRDFPKTIFSGVQGSFHVQGTAIDKKNGFVYFSFTDRLVKTDLSGKLIGSVTGFIGHLGDLDISDEGYIYGSLEYKNDAIGKGIKRELGIETGNSDGFYIAIFNGAEITRPDMNAGEEDLLRAVYIKEAVNDYNAKVREGNTARPHRFGCSGIDGLTLAPAMGDTKSKKKFLYVAYGIYGDTSRNDNDHQVILKYNIGDLQKYARKLDQGNLHQSGPAKPLDKYFVYTGNTRYGIQNLAYDAYSGNLFAAVYKGEKKEYPNYDLFVINGKKPPVNHTIKSDNKSIRVKTLSLLNADPESKPKGWHFPWGSTGLCPLGNGEFYISHNEKVSGNRQQTTLYKYKWSEFNEPPFLVVE